MAVSTMVSVAEILKKDGLAIDKKIMTCLDSINDDGRQRSIQKPKMIVELTKSEQFDQIIAEQEREAAAAKAADANGAAA
eukprot:jgi/Chrzof1/7312/Cz02g19010.t1